MLAHMHLQDADGYADRHWALGEGTIRWRAVFAALTEIDANPRLVVELKDHDRIVESVQHLEALGVAL
jgi:sugar phosphate isomerase/epimerase